MRRLAGSLALLLALPGIARGAGLYASDRGVRPMGRGGAFVAGADDLGAVWYNPAGIGEAGTSLLVDFAWVRFDSTYDRELVVTAPGGPPTTVRSPEVKGSAGFLPFPTLAAARGMGAWSVAAGVYAPYLALPSYPASIGGQPSPARYALGSFAGSRVGLPGVWVGYRAADFLRLGVGAQALVGTLESAITFSVSPPDRLIGAPEQPEYDAAARVTIGPVFAPSLSAGAILVPHPRVRLGLSGQTPTRIDADARLAVRLPTSALFDGASVRGDRARVRLDLPAILRAGLEVRPSARWRLEIAYVRELWSAHRSIVAAPRGMTLDGMIGAPPSVRIPAIEVARNFRDTDSVRLGSEVRLEAGGRRLDLRAGVSHETSAVPLEYLSLSSLDFDKTALTVGASVHLGERWRLDALFAHLVVADAYVPPERARIGRINALAGDAPFEAVNGGRYGAASNLVGVGLNYQLR